MELNIDNLDMNQLLKYWRGNCIELSKKHGKYQKEFDLKGKIIVFLSIVFSSSVGLAAFIDKNEWVGIILGCLSLSSAILQSLSKYLRYESMEMKHQELAIKYKILSNEIIFFLSQFRSEEELMIFCEIVKNKLHDYLKFNPTGDSKFEIINNSN